MLCGRAGRASATRDADGTAVEVKQFNRRNPIMEYRGTQVVFPPDVVTGVEEIAVDATVSVGTSIFVGVDEWPVR